MKKFNHQRSILNKPKLKIISENEEQVNITKKKREKKITAVTFYSPKLFLTVL
jgi:hypothetical protein